MDRPYPQTAVYLTDLAAGPGYRGALATLDRRLSVTEHYADALLADAHVMMSAVETELTRKRSHV
jgi:hypothetical protein